MLDRYQVQLLLSPSSPLPRSRAEIWIQVWSISVLMNSSAMAEGEWGVLGSPALGEDWSAEGGTTCYRAGRAERGVRRQRIWGADRCERKLVCRAWPSAHFRAGCPAHLRSWLGEHDYTLFPLISVQVYMSCSDTTLIPQSISVRVCVCVCVCVCMHTHNGARYNNQTLNVTWAKPCTGPQHQPSHLHRAPVTRNWWIIPRSPQSFLPLLSYLSSPLLSAPRLG